MELPMNIFLVGPMGVGKTSVGRQLAKLLGKRFFDSDREIELHAGASISLLFELEGEAGFRLREQSAIDEITRRKGVVLATGGGAVLGKENRAHLIKRGFVVYLHAPVARLEQRTFGDQSRPLLQTSDPRGRLERIVKKRAPFYRQVADVIVSGDRKSPRHVANHILRRIEDMPNSSKR
uniref:Shikimate kinase n=1 Tax=Candidatus Kentrum sp. TC TaxID=2126339 RepID=A0A450Z1R7_9GAMM|nr:MAG: shikimate kinase/3-dehydroquinate synthase [Candidatus Kentron sp. TC]VFK50249.1 MAG: shikimate kinase [Candidatus Kentron sp. TC]VFK63268.1 MAG: shikimate kinase/3-dehydroquinate synthase [Candidatus Kentron sp. TC]